MKGVKELRRLKVVRGVKALKGLMVVKGLQVVKGLKDDKKFEGPFTLDSSKVKLFMFDFS